MMASVTPSVKQTSRSPSGFRAGRPWNEASSVSRPVSGRAISAVRYVAGLMSDMLIDIYGEGN